MASPNPFRVVIACRDRNLGRALASLATADGIEVAAVVDSMPALAEVRMDRLVVVVTLDPTEFPPDAVIEAAGQVPVLMIGPTTDPSEMIASVEAGVLGYADADAPLEDLVEAVRSVAAGVAVIPPLLLGSLLRHVVERQRRQRLARNQLEVLTPRERQVFDLMARGLAKSAIATALFISPATARTHVQNVFRKLGVHSLAGLVALAAECGLEIGVTEPRRSE